MICFRKKQGQSENKKLSKSDMQKMHFFWGTLYKMKKDKNWPVMFQKIQNIIIFDKANEVFRKYPDKYIQKLEKIGFKYHE